MRRYATQAGFASVEILPIERDFFRFYKLSGQYGAGRTSRREMSATLGGNRYDSNSGSDPRKGEKADHVGICDYYSDDVVLDIDPPEWCL